MDERHAAEPPASRDAPVALVSMPWLLVDSPSIQLGMLHGALARAGIPCRSHSFHLAFLDFATRLGWPHGRAFDRAEYEAVSTRWSNLGAPDWVFAVPPHGPAPKVGEKRFGMLLRDAGMPAELVRKLRRLRALVPAFIRQCADEILAAGPAVVGFTAVYSQTLSSIALARALAVRAPHVRIVFGGASCEGPMGPALMRAFEEIDFVVRGEGERVLPALVRGLAAGAVDAVQQLPGLCSRQADRIVESPPGPAQRPSVEDLPVPVYDEYFTRLAAGSLCGTILPRIPYQSARGCWWGMKSHCTFCGLNGTDMEFRSKSAERVHNELLSLSKKHGVVDFTVVDNIMDMGYLATLIPRLAASPHDLSLFCETKANLSADQVARLGAAGVRTIQPGIESLSTPVLKLMGKGVTALQNIRLLKWCAQRDMHVIWNLLYGFPRESPDEYCRMAELVPSLVHLAPPNLSAMMLVRFSPYHREPERYGLRAGAPLPFYGTLYGVDNEDTLRDLASVFEHAYDDGRDPESYVGELRARVAQWSKDAARNRGALVYRRGPGFLIVTDARTTTGTPARYQLDDAEADAYLACDAGATAGQVAAALERRPGPRLSAARLRHLLRDLVDARLLYEEDGKFLSLAIPAAASWGAGLASTDSGEHAGEPGSQSTVAVTPESPARFAI